MVWIILFYLWVSVTSASAPVPFSELMRDRIEGIQRSGQCVVEGERVAALGLVSALYESNGFQPLWRGSGQASKMLSAVHAAELEGLDPKDYHAAIIAQILRFPEQSPVDEVAFELLLSDAFFRLAYHYRFGRIDPEKLFVDWNFREDFGVAEPQKILMDAIAQRRVAKTLQQLLPTTRDYIGLRAGLATYRDKKAAADWPVFPGGSYIKPGMTDVRVVLLRERLQINAVVIDGASAEHNYDPRLSDAVIEFQQQHGLKPDGIVGPATVAALNTTVQQRIDQIRINMERMRWVSHQLPEDYLLVDITGFKVQLYQQGKITWSTRAVVGRPYRETPVFRSTMTYLVLNPTWTIPPTILRRDIMPKLQQDRAVLVDKKLLVINQAGHEVNPDLLDWNNVSANNFEYLLRQTPGAHNALGRVKFMFPNKHAVYLHDTPSKSLFDKNHRAFSSGCIRIEHPLELAEILLQSNAGWTQDKLQQVVATEKTRTVKLNQDIPVLMMYFTAAAGEGDNIKFHNDLYARDKKVLAALNQKLSLTPDIDKSIWK